MRTFLVDTWCALLALAISLSLSGCTTSQPSSTAIATTEAANAPIVVKLERPPYVPNTYCSMQPSDPIYARCNVKLGLPKEEATAVLTESQRKFLDGVLRIYTEPGFLIRRKEAIAALGAEVVSTKTSHATWPDGRRTISARTDLFKGTGLFTPYEYWASTYIYLRYRYPPWDEAHYSWNARIEVSIDAKRECLPSRAVEGYLDIPLSSRIFGVVDGGPSREEWDRHGPSGHRAIAEPLSKLSPRLQMGLIDGCLSGVYLESNFSSMEVSDENILN